MSGALSQRAIFKMEMKRCYTPTAAKQRGFAWARPCAREEKKPSRLDRPTVGEASALPSFKVRLTKGKRSARFIQRRLLLVGRQKVLHMILPGALGTLQLCFSTLLFILSTRPSPPAVGAAPPPATPAYSLSLLALHFTRLSLNRPCCSTRSPKTRKHHLELLESELHLPPSPSVGSGEVAVSRSPPWPLPESN